MSVSVIIPAFRASATIGRTVCAARTIPGVSEIIVVDDGSRDGTSAAAERAGADRIITLPRNRGKGTALAAGVALASGARLLFLDADVEDSAAQAAPLLSAIDHRTAMAVAVLPRPPRSGGLGAAMALARTTIRLLTGLRVAAPLSGQRALTASLARHIGIAPRFGAEVGLTVEAAHLRVPVIEVLLPMEHRHTGRSLSGFIHRGRQFIDVLQFLFFGAYGIGWPALPRARVAVRLILWLGAFALLIALGSMSDPPASRALAVALGAAVLAWPTCLWMSAVWLSLRKPNHLRRQLPAATGILFPLIALPSILLSPLPAQVRLAGAFVVTLLAGVGLLDDLFGSRHRARGLRGHFWALATGRLTTGAVKAFGGLLAGLGAGLLLDPGRPILIVLDALLIALAANLVNLLDLRPSRALKAFAVLCFVTLLIKPDLIYLVGPLLAAAIILAPSDFAGRSMMGDVGANTLGGAAGIGLAIALDPWPQLAVIALFSAVHLLAERVSLTDLIARSHLLSFLDRIGTAHLAPLPDEAGEQI